MSCTTCCNRLLGIQDGRRRAAHISAGLHLCGAYFHARFQRINQIAQAAGHRVKAVGQAAQLVAPVDDHLPIQIASSYLFGGFGQDINRGDNAPGQQIGGDQRDENTEREHIENAARLSEDRCQYFRSGLLGGQDDPSQLRQNTIISVHLLAEVVVIDSLATAFARRQQLALRPLSQRRAPQGIAGRG